METLNIRKLIDYFMVVVAAIIAIVFYLNFDLEQILWEKHEQIIMTADDIKADTTIDYAGLVAGDDILSLTTAKEWEVLEYYDYATAVPVSIDKTSVYSLAKWIGYYEKSPSGAARRKLKETEKRIVDLTATHCPYYIMELQDGSRILVQMNRGLARQIEKGKNIELPLGQKIGMTKTAKNLLEPICKELNVSMNGVLYTIDNYWSAKNANIITYGKYAAAFVVWLVLSVALQSVIEKILLKLNN